MALADLDAAGIRPTVIAHEDIAARGPVFARAVFAHLGLPWHENAAALLTHEAPARVAEGALHNLQRAPAEVAHEWEAKLRPGEREELAARTFAVAAALEERKFDPERRQA